MQVTDFIGLFDFKWHGQNEVGNIAILVLLGDHEKTLLTLFLFVLGALQLLCLSK